ncbi:MAG: endonuclease MutS2 [Lachnospiraceae bacterium]|nr:endonuclease MutS2 [Lachnospiraceae bacterium]
MNEKVLKTLEYDKVIALLTSKADSAPGKTKCETLYPMTDLYEIEKAQLETNDSVNRILKKGSISFGDNKDLSYIIKSLEIDSILSMKELLNIRLFLENVGRIKNYGEKDKESDPDDSLTEYFYFLNPITTLSKEIGRCIISEDEMADDASPALKDIRRSQRLNNEKIKSQLNNMVNGSLRTYLQEPVVTMRNNRYCIPVKSEYKKNVNGMVHDQSQTGSTFFIEPAAVVELNNKLKELELAEQDEIKNILSGLSKSCALHTTELSDNQKFMSLLDFIFAKGKLALDLNATKPVFNEEKIININKGRHPLIDKKKVVPISFHIGKYFDLLVVTGPNTGGKTVTLKTVGLLTLMGQAGLHIPASDRSQLSVFTEVFADIGDEQSIEQSLSTFSSHMKQIVYILEHADENSLCLFDELGAGTDPTEGAALAISILSHLHHKKITTLATTHYSELKVYALSTKGVENACCEFDVETLRPTYKLLIGIPGKSNAFAISEKLGLGSDIINNAKDQISVTEQSFEDVIAELNKTRIELDKERSEIESLKNEARKYQNEWKKKYDKIEASKTKILEQANEKARDILLEAKEIADSTISDFNKAQIASSDIKDLEKKRKNVREKINEKNKSLSVNKDLGSKSHTQIDPKKLQKGDMVKIISMGLTGTLTSLPDQKGNIFVQCGIMRTQANLRDIVLVDEPQNSYAPKKGISRTGSINLSKTMNISGELNLVGKTVDEALNILDKYIDDAYMAHFPSVRIVHGKGTGALRSAVHSYLKKQRVVKEFRLGEYGEGDAGVTIVVFK